MSHWMNLTGYELLRLIVWVVGLPIIAFLVVRMVRQVRDIHALDTQLREEEERNANNPYYRMARLYEAQALLEASKRTDVKKREKR